MLPVDTQFTCDSKLHFETTIYLAKKKHSGEMDPASEKKEGGTVLYYLDVPGR